METRDGQLVQNRKSDGTWFYSEWRREMDKQMVELTLKRDCCEKGVRLISFTADKDGIVGIVE